MGDLTYTNSMMNEIRELLLNARQHVAVQVNIGMLVGLLLSMNRK